MVDESDALRRLVRAPASLSFLLTAQSRKPSRSGSITGRAEGASRRRARSSDSDEAIELLERTLVVLLNRWVGFRPAWPSECVENLGIAAGRLLRYWLEVEHAFRMKRFQNDGLGLLHTPIITRRNFFVVLFRSCSLNT